MAEGIRAYSSVMLGQKAWCVVGVPVHPKSAVG